MSLLNIKWLKGENDEGKLLKVGSEGKIETADLNWDSISNKPIDRTRKITVSADPPTGGSDGDIWIQVSE